MAQNITLLGASYSDVPAVQLPKSGGGTATFTDTSDTTAVASDVAQGKYFYLADGIKTLGTATGGGGSGGASNYVTGTFTGTTTGSAMAVNIPYTGSGFPIVVVIHPKEGANTAGTFYSKIQRYATEAFIAIKSNVTPPSGTNTAAYHAFHAYKSSSSNATSRTWSGGNATSLYTENGTASASSSGVNVLKINSANKLSVFIAASSYGFMADVEYTYHIIYSE